MRDASASAATLDWLLDEPHFNARRVLRLLRSGLVAPRPFVETGLQNPTTFLASRRKKSASKSTSSSARSGNLPSDDPTNLVGISWKNSRDRSTRTTSFSLLLNQLHANQERIKANVAALSASHDQVRRKVALRIDQLTTRLISRGAHSFDEATFVRWADLIQYSRLISNHSHLNASIEALFVRAETHAIGLERIDRRHLSAADRQLLASKGDSDFEFIPALLMLPLKFFTDWDRAKTARRELVDFFSIPVGRQQI